ncbi:MAG: histidine kinase [Spirochaetales bacterium]|nr:histidine kinase [Spirochaetales bacterium]
MVNNSLKSRLFYTFTISILLTLSSFSFSLINTIRLQKIADDRFNDEQYFISLQTTITDIQNPLKSYLRIFSTSALSDLLTNMEKLQGMLPSDRTIYNSDHEIKKREIYFLIDKYIASCKIIMNQKRGRKVNEYSKGYEELTILYNYISNKIDILSLEGFRNQLVKYNNFLKLYRGLQLYSIFFILLIVSVSFLVLLNRINSISHPLTQLSLMTEQISDGYFDMPDLEIHSVDEINMVAMGFNNMKNGVRHYISEINRKNDLEKVLKRMELYTMQAQMNPHFLFNTINTGLQLAIVEDAEKTAEYMENLASLLRYNLREKRFFVPLRKEYTGLVSYINLLKIRFPKSLNFDIDVNESILDDFECPAMLLQPLVENTVIHAFKEHDGLGTVRITIDGKDKILKLIVEDNGIGIPQDVIDNLLVSHVHEYEINSKVMGLENVIQRCFFFYPDQKDIIKIISSQGRGTRIIITIDSEIEPCIEL